MAQALRDFFALAFTRRVPVLPRQCTWCLRNVAWITQRQYRAALRDGWVTCKCGISLAAGKEMGL